MSRKFGCGCHIRSKTHPFAIWRIVHAGRKGDLWRIEPLDGGPFVWIAKRKIRKEFELLGTPD